MIPAYVARSAPVRVGHPTCLGLRVGVGEADKGVKFVRGGAGVDGLGGVRDRVAKVIGFAAGDQGGGGIEEDYIAARRFSSSQDVTNDCSVFGGIASGKVVE